jgi:hypothetical protein
MNSRAACFLVLLGAAGPAAGQTRTVFEGRCSYTKPGPEWEWLDPKLAPAGEGKAIALLRHPSGRTFTLRYRPKDQRPDANSFGSFEDDLLRTGDLEKLSSRRRSFKGETCYEIDVRSVRADEWARVRVLFANDNAYQLSVTYAPGPLGPAEETDAVFKGFEFRPPEAREDDEEEEAEGAAGRPHTRHIPVLVSVGLIPVIGFGIWLYRLRKAARAGRPIA